MKYLVQTGLPSLPSGVTDKEAALLTPLYRAISVLSQQLSLLTGSVQYEAGDLTGGDQFAGLIDYKENTLVVKALEPITYGQLVTLTVDAGKLAARVADATVLTKPAHGICTQVGGLGTGAYGTVLFMRGRTTAVGGTTLGSVYYLSTAGSLQLAVPTADGVINQKVAIGLGSAGIYLDIESVGKRVSGTYKTSVTNLRVQYTDGSYTDWAV